MLKSDLEALHRRVSALDSDRLAIAFSGGGDSTALLHALKDHPKATHAFIIDHNLRPESRNEVEQAAGFARKLGFQVSVQKWDHNNPSSAIQVKARQFRYAAMGQLCRENGLTYLLTAHTEDDQAETLLMRQERQTGWRGLAGMRKQAYGPLWPALAEVTLMRPLLGWSRQSLRDYNTEFRLPFIDDPSNENRNFTRVRAREKLSGDPTLKRQLLDIQRRQAKRLVKERAELKSWFDEQACLHTHGYIILKSSPPSELLLHLLRIVSGTGGPIDSARREALLSEIAARSFKAATLAGAWIIKTSKGLLLTRDKVAVTGRKTTNYPPLGSNDLVISTPKIWDGRFLIEASEPNIRVESAFGYLSKMREVTEMQEVFNLPEAVRLSLPVFIKDEQYIGFGAGNFDGVRAISLAHKRLHSLWSDI